jgi:hypothetical protein
MSRWVRFATAAVFVVAVAGCGAKGGDPVAGQQIPPGPTDSPQQPADSGSDQGGSDSGRGGSDDHARKVGLPESIRIPEIGQQAFEDGVTAACGSKDGAPGCLAVTYVASPDPDGCSFGWVSDPPKTPTPEGTDSIVRRGSHITVTICPQPGDTTSPAAGDTMSPAPDDGEMSTSDSPAASP